MKKSEPTNEQRVQACAQAIQQALDKYKCQMYTALKVGNAESPLFEIGGFPIVVKVADAPQTQPK